MKINIFKNFVILEDMTREEHQKLLQLQNGKGKIRSANILPCPVVRDGNGKLIKNYTSRDFFLKLQEEIFEVIERGSTNKRIAEEIADIITACISYLNAIGYGETGRSEIFRRVNEKNKKQGYFKE